MKLYRVEWRIPPECRLSNVTLLIQAPRTMIERDHERRVPFSLQVHDTATERGMSVNAEESPHLHRPAGAVHQDLT